MNELFSAAVITVSDKGSAGLREDTAGPAVCGILEEHGFCIEYRAMVPDEISDIQREVIHAVDDLDISVILTVGGTGFSKRDVTPEAVSPLFDRRADGFAVGMIVGSLKITPKAVLSRCVSGLRKESIIITLPGSLKSASENLNSIITALDHGVEMVRSTGSNNCGESR